MKGPDAAVVVAQYSTACTSSGATRKVESDTRRYGTADVLPVPFLGGGGTGGAVL